MVSTSCTLFSVGWISSSITAKPTPVPNPSSASSTASLLPDPAMPIISAVGSLMTSREPSFSAMGSSALACSTMAFQMPMPSSALGQLNFISRICVVLYWIRLTMLFSCVTL